MEERVIQRSGHTRLFLRRHWRRGGSSGTIYVADTSRHAIRKVSPSGVITTFAGAVDQPGAADGTAKVARFRSPAHLAVDAARNVYVADSGNHTIRKITPNGTVSTIAGRAGTAGASDGQGRLAHFDQPTGIAVAPNGDLYVTDRNNHTVRKITPPNVVTTVAGLPRCGRQCGRRRSGGAVQFS